MGSSEDPERRASKILAPLIFFSCTLPDNCRLKNPNTVSAANWTPSSYRRRTFFKFGIFEGIGFLENARTPGADGPQCLSNGQAERFADKFKRALLKARGEGTTDEIVQAFLFSYRTTPNPTSPGDVSPAEALVGRKLRTTFHALVPTGVQPSRTSPVSRSKLSVGRPVFVRDYRTWFPDWIEATIVAHRGSMLCDVDVGDDIWVRHHNQIRRRHCSTTTGLESMPSLSLDILLDTFAIPADRSVPEPTAAPPSDVSPSVSVIASVSPDNKPRLRRRTNRVSRSTLPM
ncbi:hypothetical protein SprV_0301378100 [Sparganum proliferum]